MRVSPNFHRDAAEFYAGNDQPRRPPKFVNCNAVAVNARLTMSSAILGISSGIVGKNPDGKQCAVQARPAFTFRQDRNQPFSARLLGYLLSEVIRLSAARIFGISACTQFCLPVRRFDVDLRETSRLTSPAAYPATVTAAVILILIFVISPRKRSADNERTK